MSESQARRALEYHEASKHHPGESTRRRLIDPALVPKQYKRYMGLSSVSLPGLEPAGSPLSLPGLATLLHYSNGIVRRKQAGDRLLEFRAASCTGALYHIEAYVVCGDMPGLKAGVYHYDARLEALSGLRFGDFRANVARALAGGSADADAHILFTSTFWRNAWRYEDRAYRHVFWDAGTVGANLLGLASQAGLQPRLHAGFVDGDLNRLLGLDPRREATVCVISLGDSAFPGPALDVAEISAAFEPLSRVEIEYPLVWRTHEAGGLVDSQAVSRWWTPPGAVVEPDYGERLEAIVERRRSSRSFATAPLLRRDLDAVLAAATAPLSADFLPLATPLILIHNVQGLTPGTYSFGTELSLIRAGDFRESASHLALDQPAAGDAAVNLYFVTSLDVLFAAHSERGYRAAQLEAGVRGGRTYLAATGLGLQATGLTFYDDEVSSLFDLPPEAAVLFLVAIGR